MLRTVTIALVAFGIAASASNAASLPKGDAAMKTIYGNIKTNSLRESKQPNNAASVPKGDAAMKSIYGNIKTNSLR